MVGILYFNDHNDDSKKRGSFVHTRQTERECM